MFARLLLLFITVPFIELMLLFKVGAKVGFPVTLGIIIFTGIFGATLTRTQGLQAWLRFQQALGEGRLPHAEVLEGLMILVAGAVLLTPGFLTDIAGFLLLVPPVRTAVGRWLGQRLKGRVQILGTPPTARPEGGGRGVQERVIEAKVIDVDSEDSSSSTH
ncbi:MAG: UPF0716 protein FxsA [Verrucomicrobiales bacterium]|jgi:UPF0716 protein FxsA